MKRKKKREEEEKRRKEKGERKKRGRGREKDTEREKERVKEERSTSLVPPMCSTRSDGSHLANSLSQFDMTDLGATTKLLLPADAFCSAR